MWQFHHSEFIPVRSYRHLSPEDGVFTILVSSHIKSKDTGLWIAFASDHLYADIG
jgi:hypothetical protein